MLAQEEARLLGHNYIGTEHLLLALVREGEGVAAKALEGAGIDLVAVRGTVEEIVGGEGPHVSGEHMPFTPPAKTVLELSLREALELGHNYIGTEHILLALLREGEGVAAKVLARYGVELDDMRQRVVAMLSGHPSPSARATPAQPQPAPNCPWCRAPLAGRARARRLDVPGEDASVPVLVVYCDSCGRALGISPRIQLGGGG